MCIRDSYGWKEGMTAQKNGGRDKLLMYAETFAPIDKRQMTFEDGLRPQLINLYRCNTILIAVSYTHLKYSLIGAMRSGAQMISYELSVGLSILTICLLYTSRGV